MTKAKKLPAKFNVYCSRTSLLWPRLNVNSCLHVKNGSMLDLSALSLDLHSRDHVMQRALRNRFGFKLPGIRRILPNLVDDHVKHGFEHVKLLLKLPCSNAITSDSAWNFPASARSRQVSSKTSLLRRDHFPGVPIHLLRSFSRLSNPRLSVFMTNQSEKLRLKRAAN